MSPPPAAKASVDPAPWWRKMSLTQLFVIANVPMAAFTVIVSLVSLVVLPIILSAADDLAWSANTEVEHRAIDQFANSVAVLWLFCLAGLYASSAVAVGIMLWTQKILADRIVRIVDHAERLGGGDHGGEIVVEAADSLGRLEEALGALRQQLVERDKVRQEEATEREQLAMIQRAMMLVDTETDAVRVVGRALETVARGTPAELLMADSSHAHLRRVAESRSAPPPGCAVEEPSRCVAVHRGTPQLFANSESLDACPRLHEREKPCSALCVPVMVMGRSVGVLHATGAIDRPPGRNTALALETLAVAFGTRSGALRSLGTAQLQAETDPLTGLVNRRSLENKAELLLTGPRKVVVVMADLDHFKRLNDTHGHAAGDRALQGFAQVLKASLRPGDVVARYGGEEFSVLLPDCSGDEAVRSLDRVRAALAAHCAQVGGPVFTVSFGISEFPRHGADLESLLKVADAALYQAKQSGRDRVVVAP